MSARTVIGTAVAGSLLLLTLAGCREKGPALPTEADTLQVEATISTNTVHIGDVVQVRLDVTHPADAEVNVPQPARDKEIVVRDQDVTRETVNEAWHRTTATYDLTSFRVGEYLLFTNVVEAVRTDGSRLTADPPDLHLKVESLLSGKEQALQPSKGLATWPGRLPRWVVALLAISLLAIVAALLVGRFLAKPRTMLNQPPPTPPHVAALRALKALRAKDWAAKGEAEPFYIELSDIIRHYLEERFDLHAPEQTTEEFIRDASEARELSPKHREVTSEFLVHADLVKFAKHRPGPPEMEAALVSGEQLVEETKEPLPEQEEATS